VEIIKRVLLLACLLSSMLLWAQSPPEIPVDYEQVDLIGVMRGTGERFSLSVSCLPRNHEDGRAPAVSFLGTDGQKPKCVMQHPRLTVGGDLVPLPGKSYSDLADIALPRGVYVTSRTGLFILHVEGGDGVAAYKVRFMIKNKHVVAREVEALDASGETKVARTAF